jgi:hypothetical protein
MGCIEPNIGGGHTYYCSTVLARMSSGGSVDLFSNLVFTVLLLLRLDGWMIARPSPS